MPTWSEVLVLAIGVIFGLALFFSILAFVFLLDKDKSLEKASPFKLVYLSLACGVTILIALCTPKKKKSSGKQ